MVTCVLDRAWEGTTRDLQPAFWRALGITEQGNVSTGSAGPSVWRVDAVKAVRT
jgi:hypothetical protein